MENRSLKTIIRPIVTFGAESWTIINKMGRTLMTGNGKYGEKYTKKTLGESK